MGSIIGSCAGSLVAGCCCGACNSCTAVKHGPMSRIPYLFLFLISSIFAIVMSLYGEDAIYGDFSLCETDSCKGVGSVFRVSFCLFVFELIHVLFMAMGVLQFHYLWFSFKFIIFALGLTLTFVIEPNAQSSADFFNGYGDFARVASCFYLLLQILILVSWSYDFKDSMLNRVEDTGRTCWNWVLLIICCAFFLGSWILQGFFFDWYGGDGCGLHKTFIAITLIITILNLVLSLVRADGSFFTSSVVSIYGTFLCFAALQADEDVQCSANSPWGVGDRGSMSFWLGILITICSLLYAGCKANLLSTLTSDPEGYEEVHEPLIGGEKKPASKPATDEEEDGDEPSDVVEGDLEEGSPEAAGGGGGGGDADGEARAPPARVQKKENLYFHLIMCLASCYFAMLFSNWNSASSTGVETTGETSMWVNIATQWVMVTLFWWTLAAPLVCPSRFAHLDE